jgi:hypothetical protein
MAKSTGWSAVSDRQLDAYLGLGESSTVPALPKPLPALPFKEVIGSRQVIIAGRAVGEEATGDNAYGNYLFPNELLLVLGKSIAGLGNEGALVSVGTIRTFIDALAMGAKDVVLLDHDAQSTRFNEVLVDLIKSSPDRHTFFARLLGISNVESFIRQARQGPTDPASQLERDRLFTDALKKESLDQNGELPPLTDAVDRHHWSSIGFQQRKFAELPRKAPEYWARSWMGNDAAYAELQNLVATGSFVPLNGSLSGATALPSIAQAFASAGKKISVLDLSNALDYMVNPMNFPKGDGFGALHKTLEAIPFSENARVLLTAHGDSYFYPRNDGPRPTEDGLDWNYVSISAKDLKAAARLGYLENEASLELLFFKISQSNTSTTPKLFVPREGFLEGEPFVPHKWQWFPGQKFAELVPASEWREPTEWLNR